jgi:hypothetical protein
MKFKSDAQRKAIFASMSKFSSMPELRKFEIRPVGGMAEVDFGDKKYKLNIDDSGLHKFHRIDLIGGTRLNETDLNGK